MLYSISRHALFWVSSINQCKITNILISSEYHSYMHGSLSIYSMCSSLCFVLLYVLWVAKLIFFMGGSNYSFYGWLKLFLLWVAQIIPFVGGSNYSFCGWLKLLPRRQRLFSRLKTAFCFNRRKNWGQFLQAECLCIKPYRRSSFLVLNGTILARTQWSKSVERKSAPYTNTKGPFSLWKMRFTLITAALSNNVGRIFGL